MNLASLVHRIARRAPDTPAIAIGAKPHLCYGALSLRIARLGGALSQAYGLQRGARVALIMENSTTYLELMYGIWHAGMTAVPINSRLHGKEIAVACDDAGIALAFCSSRTASVANEAIEQSDALKRVVEVDGREFRALASSDAVEMAETKATDCAWLFFTSGTTGRSKGAMLSSRNLMAMSAAFVADVFYPSRGACILHPAPLSHGSGLYSIPYMMRGGLQVIPESGGFDPVEIGGLLAHYPHSLFFAAPTMVKRLVDEPIDYAVRNLDAVVYGGGPMYLADCRTALDRFDHRLAQIFGQGETPMTITVLDQLAHADVEHPRYLQRLESVGLPHSFVSLRVADSEDRPVPKGEPGEILVKGDTVMAGYWGLEDASAATLRGGWLHTGDIGILDGDGFLTLRDRSKDVIISGGSNIYPREVEEVLQSHPQVREVAVIGKPDDEWGETVCAFVVASDSSGAIISELDQLCLQNIARFKRPRQYRFIEELPKNAYGKVVKTSLRELLKA
ncbi:MAG: AMP-binding protein [Phycisphaerae bacterium]|nr:AMP-binding protein [Phycisphaerae bacterium]